MGLRSRRSEISEVGDLRVGAWEVGGKRQLVLGLEGRATATRSLRLRIGSHDEAGSHHVLLEVNRASAQQLERALVHSDLRALFLENAVVLGELVRCQQ